MIVSELKLYNFRQFKSEDNKPGLLINFHRGLNALIGENDSGKSAVIDAIKLVLLTQSGEYIKPSDEDFYRSKDGISCDEFKIECTITDFNENEAKNFIEYLNYKKVEGEDEYTLIINYRAWRVGNKIFSETRVGDEEDGIRMDAESKELLKAVYLKPLRDAQREMSSGRGSRISQILLNHPAFKNKKDHYVIKVFEEANKEIEKYFAEEEDGKEILKTIINNLKLFHDERHGSGAELVASDIQLKAILETLTLRVLEINPGLGELNLLFIAAELLLLKDDTDGGIKLALIEELEAHLHPQAQLRLINYLQNEYNKNDVQIIISTHSPILASKINLKNLILMKNGVGYDLSYEKTKLEKGDYLFLQRFLDSTKANLFFARGIIMVEGDAENILIPVIADIIGYPLEKYGVSIVNVGSTAFLRYSRIMIREDGENIKIPVSVITDCDIKPEYFKSSEEIDSKINESKVAQIEKNEKYSEGSVKGFTSPRWTLEYCLALSCLSKRFHRAVIYGKKIYNAGNDIALTQDKIKKAEQECLKDEDEWSNMNNEVKAYKIFKLMCNEQGKSSLKSIVAQCLASILRWEISVKKEDIPEEYMFDLDLYNFEINEENKMALKTQIENDEFLKYIVDAIKYASGVENCMEDNYGVGDF